jgi:4-aminobutyrate aminotransferase-like enzyme
MGAGLWFKAEVEAAIARMRERGVRLAAMIVDTIFASDGIRDDPTILGPAVDAVHASGGLFIADEVQPGFCRTGAHFWGFARHGVAPDLVTMGKPMGNGIPVAGLAATKAALEPFGTSVPYFNTFGGTTVPVAAAMATLDVMLAENLADHSETLGAYLRGRLEELAGREARIGSIRQAGLFIGVEFVTGPERDARPDSPFALEVMNTMRDLGVLVSIAGGDSNVLKVRPLLSFTETDADHLVDVLSQSVISADGATSPPANRDNTS